MRRIANQKTYRPSFIRAWRIERGLTLADLAMATRTTITSISRIERGVQPYSQSTLEAIAAALQCRPADLIGRAPGPSDQILKVLETLPLPIQARAIAVLQLLVAPNDNTGDAGRKISEV